jgi:hypothetical protein
MSGSVTSIGQGAFDGCTSLTDITISANLNKPSDIKTGTTTWAQYWGIPNTATIIYPPSDSSLASITINGSSVVEGSTFEVENGTTSVTVVASPNQGTSTVTNITGDTVLITGLNTITITVTAQDESTSDHFVYVNVANVICFLEGTKILCLVDGQETYVPIETISKGTMIKTHIHGYKPIELLGRSKMFNNGDNTRIKDRLYKYTSEKHGDLLEDLIVTGGHSSLVDELSESQKEATSKFWKIFHKTDDKYRLLACVDENTIPYEEKGSFNIYHISLENEDNSGNYGIYANGLLVESCCKNFLNSKKHMELIE